MRVQAAFNYFVSSTIYRFQAKISESFILTLTTQSLANSKTSHPNA